MTPDDLSILLEGVRQIVREELAATRAEAVTITTVANMLGCGETKVYELLKAGDLTRATNAGRKTMVVLESVTKYQHRAQERGSTASRLRAALRRAA